MKMKKLLILFCTSLCVVANAQQISSYSVGESGGYSIGKDANSISFTVGGAFTQAVQEQHHLTEGFQQGQLKLMPKVEEPGIVRSVEMPLAPAEVKANFQLKIFPNPTIQYLYLESTGAEIMQFEYRIVKSDGKLIAKGTQTLHPGEQIELSEVEQLAPGHYFLDAQDATGSQQILPFIKKSY